MSRTKLKDRSRYPCGKLKPLKSETASPGHVRQIIINAKRSADNPWLRSEIGRLRLTDVITDVHVLAATRFAALLGAYDRLKGVPARSVRSPSYEQGFGRSFAGGDEDEARIKAVQKVERRYGVAVRALQGKGKAAERAVMAVVIEDQIIVTGSHPNLVEGLNALAVVFDLIASPGLTTLNGRHNASDR